MFFKVNSFIDKVNGRLVDKVIKLIRTREVKDDNGVLIVKYALGSIISECEKFIIMLIIFLLCGKCLEFLVAFMALVTLRVFIGGGHRETFLGCFFQSFSIFVVMLLVMSYIKIPVMVMLIEYVILFFWIWKNSPIVSPKRPNYSKEQRRKFKIKGIIVLTIQVVLSVLLQGVILEAVSWGMVMVFVDNCVCLIGRKWKNK